jgi:hypothetical protein
VNRFREPGLGELRAIKSKDNLKYYTTEIDFCQKMKVILTYPGAGAAGHTFWAGLCPGTQVAFCDRPNLKTNAFDI